MKRLLCYIICIVILLSALGVNAVDSFDFQISRLRDFTLLPKSYGDDPKTLLTRRQAVQTIEWMAQGSYIEFPECELVGKWEDVSDNTTDAGILLYIARYDGFFRGRIDERGKRYADFDSYVTVEEVLTMVIRMLGTGLKTDEAIEAEAEENGWGNDAVFMYAKKIGLINYIPTYNYLAEPTVVIEKDRLYEAITLQEFVAIISQALYMPTFGAWDGENPVYYINILNGYEEYHQIIRQNGMF